MRAWPILRFGVLLVALGSCPACRRQAEALPKPPLPPLEYLGEWGAPGNGPGELSRPTGLATDAVGNVYIADQGSGFIHKFDPLGHPLLSFQDTEMKSPYGIAVDSGGAVYVAEPARSSVLVFYPDGTRLRHIHCAHSDGRTQPLGIAVDDDGNLYVVDPGLHRVQKFSPRGRLLKAWDLLGEAPGEFASPAGVAVGPDGLLYVLDTRGNRVLKFTREGEFVSESAKAETPSGPPGGLRGIAVTEKYVFAADAANRRVHVWTLDGQHKFADDLGGRLQSDEPSPGGVAVSTRGELLALDGARVLRFRINF